MRSNWSTTRRTGSRRATTRAARNAQAPAVRGARTGLAAPPHTSTGLRAMLCAERVRAGVVVVNAGTHGSEPHMGFGGVKDSGTGWREAGIESLDVYSDPKVVNLVVDPANA